ncbi:MAG: phosphate-starvation-inducible PsiE family protein [Spirulinaceae cyanobacterium]
MPLSNKKINTWYRWLFHRRRIIRNLEIVQDFIVISLGVWLLGAMLILLTEVFRSLLSPPLAFEAVTSDILFLLILVELFRLLVVYLQEHRISVEVAVEVAIVSALREIIVEGVLKIHWEQILAVCAFLLVMGALLLVCYQTPHAKDLPGFSKESQRKKSRASD